MKGCWGKQRQCAMTSLIRGRSSLASLHSLLTSCLAHSARSTISSSPLSFSNLFPLPRRRKRTLPLFRLFLPYPREFCSLAPNFPGPSSPLATRPVRAAFANALPSPCSFSFTKLNTASPVVSSLSLCTLVDPTLSQVTNTSRLLYRMVSSLS